MWVVQKNNNKQVRLLICAQFWLLRPVTTFTYLLNETKHFVITNVYHSPNSLLYFPLFLTYWTTSSSSFVWTRFPSRGSCKGIFNVSLYRRHENQPFPSIHYTMERLHRFRSLNWLVKLDARAKSFYSWGCWFQSHDKPQNSPKNQQWMHNGLNTGVQQQPSRNRNETHSFQPRRKMKHCSSSLRWRRAVRRRPAVQGTKPIKFHGSRQDPYP